MILVVLLLASFLRIYNLGVIPPSLYWEEAALGVDSYSLAQTGKDYHGNPWPIIAFESFGDYKPSGYFYVLAPFVKVLGLNEFSVRLPSALAGIISVFLVYLIGTELFREKRVGLAAAATLAVMPWAIQFSRGAFEVNVATMWLLLGILCLLKARQKTYWIVWSGMAFVMSTYTYHGLRILAPLLALFTLVLFCPKLIKSVWLWGAGVLAIALMSPLLLHISDKAVSQRFAETSIFSVSSAVQVTNDLRAAHGNTPISRLIYHRYWWWLGEVGSGMVKHVNPQFLFVTGDGNGRHQVLGGIGLLFWWMVIPLILSIIQLKHKTYRISLLLLLGWIVLASIPPALSYPSPHTLRFLPASPAFALLVGFGLHHLKLRKMLVILFACFIVGEFSHYVYQAVVVYPSTYSDNWQYGYKETVQYLLKNSTSNEPIYFTRAYGRPSIYVLFYGKDSPAEIQAASQHVPKDQSELLTYKNIDFVKDNAKNYAWIVNEKPLDDSRYILMKTVNFLNNSPAFFVYKRK